VEEVLRGGEHRVGKRLYTVLARAELDALGYDPSALLALDAEEGISIRETAPEEFLGRPSASVKGAHGHRPTREPLYTGVLAAGAGIKAGVIVEKMRLIDIAPTVAKILGLEMGPVEGEVISGILK
jgi:hypothetical protein